MEKDTVIFRKNKYGEIIALFPYIIWNSYNVSCYVNNEGHSGCDYNHVIKTTKPALESEYKSLYDTLISQEYNLEIRKKYHYNTYIKAVSEIKKQFILDSLNE